MGAAPARGGHSTTGWFGPGFFGRAAPVCRSSPEATGAAQEVRVLYLALKALHVLAVVLFLGNIVTGLFWHAHAARTRNAAVIRHAMGGIILSDRLFTMPGVLVILVSGVCLALRGGYPLLRTAWILWPIVLFSVSGLAFMFRVAPLQRRLLGVAQAGAERGDFDYAAYRKLALTWELWGAVALATPVAALLIMTMKPAW